MKQGKNKTITKNWKWPRIVLFVYLVFIFVLILQFTYLSLSKKIYGDDLKKFAVDRLTVEKELIAKRGTIFDSEGNVLAINVTSYRLVAYLSPTRTTDESNPHHVVDPYYTAEKLSTVLDLDYDYILEKLLTEGRYQVYFGTGGDKLTELTKLAIEELELPGIDFEESTKRFYPNGSFASYIIGYAKQTARINLTINEEYDLYYHYKNYFTNYENVVAVTSDPDVAIITNNTIKGLKEGTTLLTFKSSGSTVATILVNVTPLDTYITEDSTIVGELGIESKFNKILSGVNGLLMYQKDPSGYQIPDTPETRTESVDGYDIYLTVDSSVQRFLESAVSELAQKYNPEWTILVAMNAKTGEILGSATNPSFDPGDIPANMTYQDPLTAYTYEPGSTMKIYTYMCAMENNVYNGTDEYLSGSYSVGTDVIHDWLKTGWGYITFNQGFQYSSNVGVINLIKNGLTAGQLKTCLQSYGFGNTTGIELSNEASGNIDFNGQIEIDTYTAGYGQGISTTVIQQLQALTLIANNGSMVNPHIISKIVDNNTNTVYKTESKKTDKIVSDETITKIKELMRGTVSNSWATGHAYYIDGFDIIGKTGTAQIFENGQYSDGHNYIVSFAGMYPGEDPEIIIYAAMKKPSNSSSYALAPSVKQVIENIAKYYNMFNSGNEDSSVNSYNINSYVNESLESATSDLNSMGMNVISIGNGSKVISQYPKKNSIIITGDKVFLTTNDSNITMPSMTNWSRNEIITFCNLVGLKYELTGYGYAVSQNINPGDIINSESSLSVTLNNKYNLDT